MTTKSAGFRLLLAVPLLALGVAFGSPSTTAAAYACSGAVSGGTIQGDVVVAPGASCTLEGVSVRGSVSVGAGAALTIGQGTDIRGSVAADGAGYVSIKNSLVRGNVVIANVANPSAGLDVSDSEVRGSVTLAGNTVFYVALVRSSVRGGAAVTDNAAQEVVVDSNTLRGTLACAGNYPAPQGTGNSADGGKTGQCAGL